MPYLYRCLLLILLLAYFRPVQAQSDWLPGYVVTNTGDTLRGLVRDRDTGTFGSLFTKVQLDQPGKWKKRYRPGELRGYRRGNTEFIVLRVVSVTEFLKTRNYIDDSGEAKFYRIVHQGPLNLYLEEFTDFDNFTIEQVPYFNKENDAELVRATQGIFGLKKKQLARYFADRPDLVEMIESGNLSTPMDIVNMYEPDLQPSSE